MTLGWRSAVSLHGFFTRCRWKTETKPLASSACAPTRSAASRAVMAGWAGEGGGRFGERREYEAPTLPSTPRQHGAARHQTRQPRNASRETARHHKSQARNGTPRQHSAARHATTHASRETAKQTHQSGKPPQKPGKKQHATPTRHATRTTAPGHSRMTDASGCVNIVS